MTVSTCTTEGNLPNFDPHQPSILTRLSYFHQNLEPKTLITGGHIVLGDLAASLNDGTVLSFYAAVRAYKSNLSRGVPVGLGILINDIGMVCGANSCSINKSSTGRTEFKFPDIYARILDEAQVPVSGVQIFWEKHMRNRGQKELLKRLDKHPRIRVIDGESWLVGENSSEFDDSATLLARRSAHCESGTPACPLIMGAYGMDQHRRGYTTSVNFYYVGEDNFENIPNHFNIEKGVEVAAVFEPRIQIKNIYFSEQDVFSNFNTETYSEN